jgi:signal peptidase II
VSESSSRPPVSSGSAGRAPLRALTACVAVLTLDQVTKHWAVNSLDNGRVIDLVWTLRLRLTFNSGASFSIASGRGGLIAAVGLVVLVVAFRSVLRWEGRLAAIGMGIAAGGALGNLTDRVFRAGEGFLGGRVVDFLDPQWWPVFNVADIAIFSGAGLVFLASRNQP